MAITDRKTRVIEGCNGGKSGDALFYPSMWWHQVEALAALRLRAELLNRLNR